MHHFSKGRLIFLVALLSCFSINQAQKPQRNYNADSLPFVSLFDDVVNSLTQQMRKMDLVLTKFFKTFVVSEQIDLQSVEDLIKFSTQDLDFEITPHHHLEEMLIDIRKSNSKDINATNNFCLNNSCRTNINPELSLEQIAIDQGDAGKRLLTNEDVCNAGKLTDMDVEEYKCGQSVVSKETYDERSKDPKNLCTKSTRTEKFCICPIDYFGFNCEKFVGLKCKVTLRTPQTNCSGEDSIEYVYGFGGYPPCNIVGKEQKVAISGVITCENRMQDTLFEGVKQFQFTKNMSNSNGSRMFNYYLANPKLALTNDPEVKIQVAAINWANISNPIETIIPVLFIADEVMFSTELTVDDKLLSAEEAGRIYIEINIKSDKVQVDREKSPVVHLDLLERSSGREKPTDNTGSTELTLLIILGIIGVVLIVALLVVYFLNRNKRRRIHTGPVSMDMQLLSHDIARDDLQL